MPTTAPILPHDVSSSRSIKNLMYVLQFEFAELALLDILLDAADYEPVPVPTTAPILPHDVSSSSRSIKNLMYVL